MKIRPIKFKFSKFFGWKDHRWATFNGSERTRSYKEDYGHFSPNLDDRTKAERLQKAINDEHKEDLKNTRMFQGHGDRDSKS